MNCFECDRESHGMCKFCGRGVCKDHYKLHPYVLAIYPQMPDQVLMVEKVLKCKHCNPIEQLVKTKLTGD